MLSQRIIDLINSFCACHNIIIQIRLSEIFKIQQHKWRAGIHTGVAGAPLINLPSESYGKMICLSVVNAEYVSIPFSADFVGLKYGLTAFLSENFSGRSALACIPLKIFATIDKGTVFPFSRSSICRKAMSDESFHGLWSSCPLLIRIDSNCFPVHRSTSESTLDPQKYDLVDKILYHII